MPNEFKFKCPNCGVSGKLWRRVTGAVVIEKIADVEVDPFCIDIDLDAENHVELSRASFLYSCGECGQELYTPEGYAVGQRHELVAWLRAHEGCDFSRGEPFDWGETAE